jgi:aspartyl aminopeptidase
MFTDFISRLTARPVDLLRESFILSADMAHGTHPNYASHHDPNHKIHLNKGVVLKFNQNMRYSGTPDSHAIMQDLAGRLKVPLQIFSSRNESPCGSTIGPFMASLTGAEAADVGLAQFAMHSCREICGALDLLYYHQFMVGFFD